MRRILSVVLVIFFSVKNGLHMQPLAGSKRKGGACRGGSPDLHKRSAEGWGYGVCRSRSPCGASGGAP